MKTHTELRKASYLRLGPFDPMIDNDVWNGMKLEVPKLPSNGTLRIELALLTDVY